MLSIIILAVVCAYIFVIYFLYFRKQFVLQTETEDVPATAIELLKNTEKPWCLLLLNDEIREQAVRVSVLDPALAAANQVSKNNSNLIDSAACAAAGGSSGGCTQRLESGSATICNLGGERATRLEAAPHFKAWRNECVSESKPDGTENVIFSDSFERMINRRSHISSPITFDKITKAFEGDHDAFRKGIRHLVRFGGSFSYYIEEQNGKHYVVEGSVVTCNARTAEESRLTLTPRLQPLDNENSIKQKTHLLSFLPRLKDAQKGCPFGNGTSIGKPRSAIFLMISDNSKSVKTEQDLQQTSEKLKNLQLILDSVPVPIWGKGKKGKVLLENKAFSKFWEKLAINNRGFRNGDEVPVINLKNEREIFRIEEKCVANPGKGAKVGEVENVEDAFVGGIYNSETVITEKSSPSPRLHTVGIAQDISVYKDLIEKNCKAESEYFELLNALETPLLIIEGTTIKAYNSAFLQFFNIAADFFKENTTYDEVLDLLAELRKLPEDTSLAEFKKLFKGWLEEETENANMCHLPDGTVLSVTVHKYGPVIEPANFRGLGILVMFKDISKEMNAEREHKLLESVYSEIITRAREAILIIGTDRKIKQHSKSVREVLDEGAADTNLVGTPIRDFFDSLAIKQDRSQTQPNHFLLAIETRNARTGYMQKEKGEIIAVDYSPLPNGWHLLTLAKCLNATTARCLCSNHLSAVTP
ncbi:MAG: hypothetical protein LBF72_01360 [Holosporales bacterium]|jgi:PAS domain-containing protein|nr:hypothetical protein [Holosporales bacterium]